MKRIIPLLMALAFIVSFSGCSQRKTETDFKSMSESFILISDGVQYAGDVFFDSDMPMSIKLEKPYELEGIALTVRPEGVSVTCGGVSFDTPSASKSSPFLRLYGVLVGISSDTITVDRDGFCEKEIEFDGGRYSFIINCESGRISEISGDDFHIKFNGT